MGAPLLAEFARSGDFDTALMCDRSRIYCTVRMNVSCMEDDPPVAVSVMA